MGREGEARKGRGGRRRGGKTGEPPTIIMGTLKNKTQIMQAMDYT